jgi:branched-chain amino acid transport system permease protein
MVGTIMIYAILRTAWTSSVIPARCWATPAVRCRPYTAGVVPEAARRCGLIIPASIAVTAGFGALLALAGVARYRALLGNGDAAFGTIIQILIEMTLPDQLTAEYHSQNPR